MDICPEPRFPTHPAGSRLPLYVSLGPHELSIRGSITVLWLSPNKNDGNVSIDFSPETSLGEPGPCSDLGLPECPAAGPRVHSAYGRPYSRQPGCLGRREGKEKEGGQAIRVEPR